MHFFNFFNPNLHLFCFVLSCLLGLLDEVIQVTSADAIAYAKSLALEEVRVPYYAFYYLVHQCFVT